MEQKASIFAHLSHAFTCIVCLCIFHCRANNFSVLSYSIFHNFPLHTSSFSSHIIISCCVGRYFILFIDVLKTDCEIHSGKCSLFWLDHENCVYICVKNFILHWELNKKEKKNSTATTIQNNNTHTHTFTHLLSSNCPHFSMTCFDWKEYRKRKNMFDENKRKYLHVF